MATDKGEELVDGEADHRSLEGQGPMVLGQLGCLSQQSQLPDR
jgi:hypothetical protein